MIKLGITRAYATSLQRMIASSTDKRMKAFVAGMGVTTILQSSTATTMICASFASKQMIGLSASLAVIIGADIGTTLVAQILTFDLSWLTPLLLVIGVGAHHKYEHEGRKRHIARAIIGLGLVLLSLSLIKQSAAPLGQSEILPVILQPLEREPVLALIVMALITWLLHSSLAAVLIVASFTASGLITMNLGLLLILGANLGGALITYAVTFRMNSYARRITIGNMMMRITCIIITLPFLGLIAKFFSTVDLAGARELIHFHTAFNIGLGIIFLPLITPLAKLCEKIVKDDMNEDDKTLRPLYLDESSLQTPTLALACAARETLRIAKMVENMLIDAMRALKYEDEAALKRIHKEDDNVDTLHNCIKLYLTKMTENALDPKESDRFIQILSFSTNLEHIGDIIDHSLTEIIQTKIEKQKRFSTEGFKEIQDFHANVLENMKLAQVLFMSEDPKLARQLIDGKAELRQAALTSTENHFARLRKGIPETHVTSSLHTDIIRDYKRINSYITSVAFSIYENAKKHRAKRNRKNKDSIEDVIPLDHKHDF